VSVAEILRCDHSIKATEQYCAVMLFSIMLKNVILVFVNLWNARLSVSV